MRSARAWLPLLLFPVLLGAAATRGGKPTGPLPTLVVTPQEIEASPDLAWNFELRVVNARGAGLYCDSASARLEDKDPGETRTSRIQTLALPSVSRAVAEISASDSGITSQVIPASFETGTMTLKLFFHRNDGSHFAVATPVLKLLPGPTSKEHPSHFLTVDGKKVETVTFAARPEGPAAGLLIVHDHGSHARKMLALGSQLALRGYTTMFVSLPGYGQSEGPSDFSGPHTLNAVAAAIDDLERTAGVDSQRVAVWGIGRGANAAMNLATRRRDLKLVIGQSGLYDLRAVMTGTPAPETRAAILAEAGKDSAAWKQRSPSLAVANIHSPTVILHGGADPEAPIAQAQAFADALTQAGDTTATQIYPVSGHVLSHSEMMRGALPFLDVRLRRR